MNKKIILKFIASIISCIFLVLVLSNISEASTVNLTATSTEIEVGQQVTVTASVTSGGWNLTLEGAGQSKGLVGQTSVMANSSTSTSITFTPTSAGKYTFTLKGDVTDYETDQIDSINKTLTINVKAKENNNNSNNTGGETTNSNSSESRLKMIKITPSKYDFSGFNRDVKTYPTDGSRIEVPYDVSQINIIVTKIDSNQKVSGDGIINLKEGNNDVKISVTSPDGSKTTTYTIKYVRSSKENEDNKSEARLKNLGIRPEEYDFSGFKKDTTSYSVEVPNEVTEVEVYAEPVNSKAQITGTGKITLNEGLNKVEVKVIAEDGTEMVYTIEVTRVALTTEEVTENNEELLLSSLSIKNFNLSPKFDPETYEYTLGIKEDIDSLEIEAKANNSNATVEIVGNENLKNGENIITILVSNPETEEYATYQIIVNKNTQSEVAGIVNWLDPSTWGLREKILAGVVVALVIIIIVAIIIKVKLARKEDEDLDLPGADELDRALAEHQELTDEAENETQNEINQTNNYRTVYDNYETSDIQEEKPKTDIEKAQEYFEAYTKRKGKHF